MPHKVPRCLRGTQHLTDLLLSILVIAIALATRLPALDVFITPDEYRWVCRGVMFYRGLYTGNLAQTRQTGHPGVLTMWLGVPAMGVDPLDPWLDPCVVASDPEELARAAPDLAPRLAAILYRGRRGVAVFTSVLLGLIFLLLVRLVGRRTALLAGALLLVDPFMLAHSRLLHLDAVSAVLLALSVLSLAIAVREDRLGFWALSGASAALATANKSPSGLAAPFALLVILLWAWRARVSRKRALQAAAIWLGAAGVAFVASWPAMWIQPLRTIVLVLGTALSYAESPHATGNYFWGAPTADPGPLFYPVALAFRLTPWTLLGAALSLPWLFPPSRMLRVALRPRQEDQAGDETREVSRVDAPGQRWTLWIVWGFVLAYMLFMTTGQKKFDRYILPVFPLLQVAAALGVALTARWIVAQTWSAFWLRPDVRRVLAIGAFLGVLGLGAATVLPHAPYYLTYYNPLLGGGRAAASKILVGWGEGLDRAVDYLNDLPVRPDDRVVNRLPAVLASQYHGLFGSSDDYDLATTDYVILYVNEVQRGLDPELLERYYLAEKPLSVIRLHGIDYAWVYANKSYEWPIDQIDAEGDARTDRLIVSRDSLVGKHYQGALPMETLSLDNNRQGALDGLQSAAGEAQRIWYVRYPDADTVPGLEWVDFLWQTHAFKLAEHDYGEIRLSLWQTRGRDTFNDPLQSAQPLDLRFGDELVLSGYTPLEPTIQWGRSLGLLLDWRALRGIEHDYAVSIKIVDDAGRVWGQGDRWIADESLLPTSQWKAGHQGASHVAVDLAPGTPPGRYALRVSVYDRASREPLALASGAKPSAGGAVLGSTAVVPSVRHPEPGDLAITERRNMQLTPELRLLGWTVERDVVRFGDPLPISLFWQATGKPQNDYRARIQVLGGNACVWAQLILPLAGDEYPTSEWSAGEVIARPYDLSIADDATATDARVTLVLLDRDGQPIAGPVDLANVRIEGHYLTTPPIGHRQEARLGEQIDLLGYDLEASQVQRGGPVVLTLYWRARQPLPEQYKVFVHMIGADGKLWGQKDTMPLDGYYPTDRWRNDEVVVDRYSIPVAGDAPRGSYRLAIGMYNPSAEGRRLHVTDARGAVQPEDRLLLDTEIVVP